MLCRHPGIWDAVHTQLASTYLIMGLRTQYASTHGPQRNAQLTQETAKDACELLLRALKMYDTMKDEHQAGIAHLHLAALYGKMIRYGSGRENGACVLTYLQNC